MTQLEKKESIEKLENLWRTSRFNEAKEFAKNLIEQYVLLEDAEILAKVYNNLGIIDINLSDYKKALEWFSKALHINKSIRNKNGIASNLTNLGLLYARQSDHINAVEQCTQALSINEEIGNQYGILAILNTLGLIYSNLNDYTKSLEFYFRSLSISEAIENQSSFTSTLTNIGNVYLNLSDYPKALEYYFKALHISQEIGNKINLVDNLNNIGVVYEKQAKYPIALENFSKALLINEEIGNVYGIASNLGNIGNVYLYEGDYSNAYEYYYKSFKYFEDIENLEGIALTIGNIGGIYTVKESSLYDKNKALENLQKAIHLAKEIGAKSIIKDAYGNLHTLFLNEDQFEEALEYFKKSVELEKEIQSEEAKNKAQLFDQRRKIEEDEKARQLKLVRFQEQEKILHTILPVNIADRILNHETFIADYFEIASVLFFDIVNFTQISSLIPPKQLVYLLDAIFQKADVIIEKSGLEKIKTIGDGYLAVANVTSPLEEHQKATALAALQLLETMKEFTVNIPSDLGASDWIQYMKELEIRIGIHTGEVVAGIIGKNKYTYDLWGDAVNVASRMESNSEAGRIHISEEFAKSIESHPEFLLIPRGTISIKGKGSMNTFWLEKGK